MTANRKEAPPANAGRNGESSSEATQETERLKNRIEEIRKMKGDTQREIERLEKELNGVNRTFRALEAEEGEIEERLRRSKP
jgi:septal ring factor EnvC (AmiA/AmiB activator)